MAAITSFGPERRISATASAVGMTLTPGCRLERVVTSSISVAWLTPPFTSAA